MKNKGGEELSPVAEKKIGVGVDSVRERKRRRVDGMLERMANSVARLL